MNLRRYFAYGSNLNNVDWENWCRENRFPAGLLKFHSTGYLPDHELAFTYDSHSRKGGVLDLRHRPGQLTPGAIFDVDESGCKALDKKEGVELGIYERFETIAFDGAGGEIPVTTYRIVKEKRRENLVEPDADYVKIVREGLDCHGLPADQLLAAAEDRTPPWLTDAFFFYGTLLRGESRFSVLPPLGLKCILLAQTFGRLIDLGEYPGLIEPSTAEKMVCGEFTRVDDVAAAVDLLDGVEGFLGFERAGSLFRRTMIGVDVGDGRIRHAWTYRYARPPVAPVIGCNDWREHRHGRQEFIRRLTRIHTGDDDRRVAAEIANGLPWSFADDREATVTRFLPLADAVARGEVSERRLAQVSGNWTAIP